MLTNKQTLEKQIEMTNQQALPSAFTAHHFIQQKHTSTILSSKKFITEKWNKIYWFFSSELNVKSVMLFDTDQD